MIDYNTAIEGCGRQHVKVGGLTGVLMAYEIGPDMCTISLDRSPHVANDLSASRRDARLVIWREAVEAV